jgi:hypothetical protein
MTNQKQRAITVYSATSGIIDDQQSARSVLCPDKIGNVLRRLVLRLRQRVQALGPHGKVLQPLERGLKNEELISRQQKDPYNTSSGISALLTSLIVSVSPLSSVQPSSNTEVFSYFFVDGDEPIARSQIRRGSTYDVRNAFDCGRLLFGMPPWSIVRLVGIPHDLI